MRYAVVSMDGFASIIPTSRPQTRLQTGVAEVIHDRHVIPRRGVTTHNVIRPIPPAEHLDHQAAFRLNRTGVSADSGHTGSVQSKVAPVLGCAASGLPPTQ